MINKTRDYVFEED